ncbi:hypothetical protein COU00_01020 [Candidatus Falkowbacteria bacterium CG10_big_fil_rev_8_21_14_0_10_43_11]|uniref:DUF5666 domain-containing protein n=1 Tax=Candidatus Falkowbacteria bacterium CG10_big_fil_rev_8_21_14_0_10_43_11 TaxID=1974568 RepID=A0A2M6WML4_9BACT|nr:MAG: hypothetical protein COU00_01020 [Candidatus Falkowbacteria bacterium CG10_big_fil_rev_8_21_14_0_10_43_11]
MDKQKMSSKAIIVILIIIIVSGGFFYAGLKYGQSKGKAGFAQMQGGRNRMQGFINADQKGNQGSGFLTGEIIAKDDKSVTVKINSNRVPMAPGADAPAGQNSQSGTKIIFFSASTSINKQADGTLADLAIGKQITANGTANSDGSITAQSIQIRPETLITPPQQ